MAIRKVYISSDDENKFIDECDVEFQWYPGFSVSQKQKSIESLHNNFKKIRPDLSVLEISTKSDNPIGVSLSAFNLMITTVKKGESFTLESAFQSSKVFELGGPYKDILKKDSKSAKRDERLRNSGKVVAFEFCNRKWDIEPKTLFYDWLYINTVYSNDKLREEIIKYDAFTDIEFNEKKSVNCQAKSAALYVNLHRKGLITDKIKEPDYYINIIKKNNEELEQIKLNI